MQYRGRVKGREPNDAYAVGRLNEPPLVRGDGARRPDLAVVGGGTGRYCRRARPGDRPREATFTGTAAGDVRAHHPDVEGGVHRRGTKGGSVAIGREGAGIPGPVRAGRRVGADGEPAVSCPGLSGAA